MNVTQQDLDRFNRRIEVSPSGCWEWTGCLNTYGYGRFSVGCTQIAAHRFAAMLWLPTWHPALNALHHCDNPPCANPDHLYMGTHADNARDRSERNRIRNQYMGATHCIHGHEFNEENTRITNRGYRECRACARDRQEADRNNPEIHDQRLAYWREYRAKQKASA